MVVELVVEVELLVLVEEDYIGGGTMRRAAYFRCSVRVRSHINDEVHYSL